MLPPLVLIGRKVKLFWNGIWFKGIVVDETRNMLIIDTEKKMVKIPKKGSLIELKQRLVDGEFLLDQRRRAILYRKLLRG